MSVKKLKKTFSFLLLFLLSVCFLNAQRSTVSPYSRYGIGEVAPNSFVSQTSMGGIGNAIYSNDKLNFVNPASYSFDTITVFDAGISGELSQLSTDSSSQTANGASVSYLAFGFPVIKNKWGASFGVMPYSNVGYNVTTQATVVPAGKINYTFKGDGGITRFYLGNGYAPFANLADKFSVSEKYKKLVADKDTVHIKKINHRNDLLKGLSVGFNASWLFGSLNESRSVEYLESPLTYNTRIINTASLGDIYFNFGLLYTYTMKNEKFFNLGLTGAMSTAIHSKINSLWYNYTSVGGAYENAADTILYLADQPGNTTIPVYYSGGIATGKKGKWIAALDFTIQDWSKFQSSIENQSLKSSYNIALGGEYIPNKKGFKFSQKIQYRMGVHYTKSYLTLNNTDIKDYGIAFGFGLPVINKDRVQKATFQIGFEAGQKGTKESNLLQQQYLRFHLGVTLNEIWFFKRRYD